MVEKKKKSHRVPAHKKYKIERKITAHYKKIRRLAKKNKAFVSRKQKKDPGIPNSWPFKQEMLEEALAHKEKLEAANLTQKEARAKALKERRQLEVAPPAPAPVPAAVTVPPPSKSKNPTNINQLVKDVAAREKVFTTNEQKNKDANSVSTGSSDNIPGVTMQAYYREFRKVIEAADVILEVLDARDPAGCRCPDVEKMITSKYPNKRVVLLLNKIDLIPRDVAEGWLKYLRNELPTIAFKSSRQVQKKQGQSSLPVANASSEALKGSSCLGADTLLQLLKHYSKSGNIQTSVTVGIVGFPNVGKSSVINSLCRTRAVKVGATPGVTRTAQEVHLDKHVKLLDSPGIVFPKSTDVDDDIVLRHCVQLERVVDPVSPVEAILRRVRKHLLMQVYNIPDFDDVYEFLRHIARTQGKVGKGGVADVKAAARKVLQDWVSGKVPFYTEAPEVDKSIHVGAEIVSGFSENFDFSQPDILNSLRNRQHYQGQAVLPIKSVTETGKGETSTSITVDDMLEEPIFDDEEDDKEDGQEDHDEEMHDNASDVSHKTTTATTTTTTSFSSKKGQVLSTKQDLFDEADKYNPQLNRNLKKQRKNEMKKKNKQKKAPSRNDPDAYNFATDFGATSNGSDIELADIDT